MKKLILVAASAGAVFVWAGCSSSTMTNPSRAVTEQLLLSTAADRAIASVSLDTFNGKKIYLDGTYFDSYDSKYVLGSIRDALSQAGAFLMPSITNAQIVIEARSGGLSTDQSSTLIGIPQTGVPVPLSGTLAIQEFALWKSERQNAIAKFKLLAYTTEHLEHYYSSGPMVGKAYNKNFKLLGAIEWNRSDIPEKQKPKKLK